MSMFVADDVVDAALEWVAARNAVCLNDAKDALVAESVTRLGKAEADLAAAAFIPSRQVEQ